ncbi:NIF3-like protein 1 isoform X2 [Planococcus citri]|uniref:NIF3-like protein 1 isoform X2 n=1 Tax=Planococcus citri TaxID=170843 RepID=UPI0031F95C69
MNAALSAAKLEISDRANRLQIETLRRCIMSTSGENCTGISLKTITQKLLEFAPASLAESWDNVGLLLEPTRDYPINRILLTNDLTEDVLEEALSISANLIISYHPPLFVPIKKITQNTWKERIVSKCLANNIAIYSPHTTWDVIEGGVNDWLASAYDFEIKKPLIVQKCDISKSEYIVTVESSSDQLVNTLNAKLCSNVDFKILSTEKVNKSNIKFTVRCSNDTLQTVLPILNQTEDVLYFYVNPHHMAEESERGLGRMCTLKNEITIQEAVEKLKCHIDVPHVQLALARKATLEHKIKTIAFVAGSGGSVMKNIHCDLKITGEASHHEVLDSVHNGASVILTNHSNSERGFLAKFKEILGSLLNNSCVSIVVSKTDSDPLKVF